MKEAFIRFRDGYIRFVEKQGFPIIVTLCVAVITATAVWTTQSEESYVSPTPPVMDNVSAAQLIQQPLRDAATPTPAPTVEPQQWVSPLDEVAVIRPFDTAKMVQNGVSGMWMIHDSADLKASQGDKVYAISDGVVTAAGKDELLGTWIKIDHGSSVEALYAGMALAGAYIPGDDVCAGDTIGFAGNAVMDETDLGPHLHLRVTKNGIAIDPLGLWETFN